MASGRQRRRRVRFGRCRLMGTVTATHHDGAKWGWPGARVIRYEGDDGSWAWVPSARDVGDRLCVDNALKPPRRKHSRKRRGW